MKFASTYALLSRAPGSHLLRLDRRWPRDPRHRGQDAAQARHPVRLSPALPRLHPHAGAALRSQPAAGDRRGHRRRRHRLAQAALDHGHPQGDHAADHRLGAGARELRGPAPGRRPHRRPQHPRERAGRGRRQAYQHRGGDLVQCGAAHLRHPRFLSPRGNRGVPAGDPKGAARLRISDVFVDDRGIVYAMDRARGRMYVLEYTGQQPLD